MAGARTALAENRLTTPPGDIAVEKLEAVLKLEPNHSEARSSLTAVGGRYLEMANAEIQNGDVETARGCCSADDDEPWNLIGKGLIES